MGNSVVAFMDLPAVERCILRLVMQNVAVTYPQLQQAVTTLPADQQIDQKKFDSTLEHLLENHWLTRQISDDETFYRLNNLQRSASQDNGLWNELSAIGTPQVKQESMSPQQRGKRLPSHIWDCLTDPPPDKPASQSDES